LFPLPLQTIHATLAPSGFLPEPPQKTHFFAGVSISTSPLPLQTKQSDIGDNSSNGSFPVPLQNAHLIFFDMAMWL
jgi:hypothetical protein